MNDNERTAQVKQNEAELAEKQEELDSQRGMLSAAIDELARYNRSLESALAALKERNSDLEKLLYQASHGLRSPLSSIQGILNLLKTEALSEVAKGYCEHIEQKSGHMLEILNSLSTLAELITKNVKTETVNVDGIVTSLIMYLTPLSKSQGVRFDTRSDGNAENVRTDGFLINAFLKQIIMNAVHFRAPEKNGVVSISTIVHANSLTFFIEDDGDGIDPVLGERIFEMFFRGSEKSGGSGLGLFIARLAIDLLGGTIRYAQRERGTVFEIHIPLNQPAQPIN